MSNIRGDLLPANREDIVQDIQFALSRARPRSKNWSANLQRNEAEDRAAAERVADHLQLAGFRIFRLPPHDPGACPMSSPRR